MQKFNVEIETLSPIHIGNGNYLSLLDFLVIEADENYFVYKFNQNKLVRNLSENLQNEYLEVLEKNDFIEIKDFFYKNLGKLQEIVKDIYYSKIKTNKSFYDKWYDKLKLSVDDCEGDTYEAKLNDFYNKIGKFEIQEFINQKGKFYIPGSSLKGAIRSCLISEKDNWGISEDPFKSIIVRDSDFLKDDNIFIKEKYRAGKGTYIEFIKSGINFKTEIVFRKFLGENDYRKLGIVNKEDLVSKINNFTKEKISRYINGINEFIDFYNDKDLGEKKEQLKNLKKFYENILNQINNELKSSEAILLIGFGGGFWFKTYLDIKNKSNCKELKDFILQEKHPKFCTNHWHWAKTQKRFELVDFEGYEDEEIEKICENIKCNNISGTEVKKFNQDDIQIPRTWWTVGNQYLNGFIKLTFKD